jgi:hypothetical protein
MLNQARPILHHALVSIGISCSHATPWNWINQFLSLIQVVHPVSSLIRLGGSGDGGYWIPDDLEGIAACFSPGVGPTSAFELDVAQRDIPVFMADKSVERPACSHPHFNFVPFFLSSYSDECKGLISLDDWVSKAGVDASSDLLLQMDIEGSEYEVIHSMSADMQGRFRVIVIEFHSLHQLLNCNAFAYVSSAFNKLLQTHSIVCTSPNLHCEYVNYRKLRFPRILEVTFIRNDRLADPA